MPRKILTVDDSRAIRLLVTRAFRDYDCAVVEASNGEEGLAVAGREKPDLIILDISMPVMDGLTMLANLRQSPDLMATPVVMLSAEMGRENVLKAAQLGVRDYLLKPFKDDQLIEKARRLLGLQKKSTAPPLVALPTVETETETEPAPVA